MVQFDEFFNFLQIVRRRSPRMSMASGDVRQSFRERNTPDSARNSSLQLSTNRPGSTAAANAAANSQTRNGTPPVEKDGDMFRYDFLFSFNSFKEIPLLKIHRNLHRASLPT